MLTIAEEVWSKHFTLWLYGTEKHRTQVYDFLESLNESVKARFDVRLECIVRQIDSNPMFHSHEDNFKKLEGQKDLWILKFVSLEVRIACVWDTKPEHLVMIFGVRKKGQKWKATDVNAALVERAKYLDEAKRIGRQREQK